MPHGKLSVVVEGATGIKDPGMHGQGGSYCTLTCGRQAFRSPTVEGGGRHPLFSTAFEFEIDRSTTELKVCIYSDGGSARKDEMVGYCILIFKQVFYHGHTVPLTAYPVQLPSGNPGGKINMSLKFKMRPKALNAQLPLHRCSSPPQVTPELVGRQSLPLDWGYECDEERYNSGQIQREPRQPENYAQKRNYRNLPGTASDDYREAPRGFMSRGNAIRPCPHSSQTPIQTLTDSAALGRQRTEDKLPLFPGKPELQVVQKPHVLEVQIQLRPGVVVHVAGEAANGFAEGVGNGLAKALEGELGLLGGVGQAMLQGKLFNL